MSGKTMVTGIGVTAPNGLGAAEYWDATLRGESALAPLTRFDPSGYRVRLAGEVRGFNAEEHLPARLLPQTDYMTQLSLAATEWALQDSGVRPEALPEYEMAVVTGATSGGYDFGQHELQKLWAQGPEYVSTYQSFAWFYAVNTGQISIRHGMRGPGAVVVTDQAGGLDSVGHARRKLRKESRLAVTGAVDSSLCPWAWVAHLAAGSLSERDDPRRAYLPFDRTACGHVPGEGGAILILETEESAATRPDTGVYGEIAGYGAAFDSRREDAEPGLARAAEMALADAGMTPREIDVVFADGAAVPAQDQLEAAVIARLFGPHGVPVTVPKTMTGRLYAGGGALDLATALLAIRHDVIPPTVNVHDVPPDYRIDLVREKPLRLPVRSALILARGRHGFNAAIVAREVTGRKTRREM